MRGVRPFAASWLVVAACASGSDNVGGVDAPGQTDGSNQEVDASPTDASPTDAQATDAAAIDAQAIDATVIDAAVTDAAVTDAMVTDAMVTDAMVTDAAIDAGCTTMVLQILANPAFDSGPTGWTQEGPNIVMFPLITPDDGIPEHTAPNKAWLGGIVSQDDALWQQVTVPANTTILRVRGQYEVRTGESGGTVYDTGTVELLNSSNGLLQTVVALNNVGPTAAWTAFNVAFSQPYAGQAVRLRFRTHNDFSLETSFYFDTIFLEATVCQ